MNRPTQRTAEVLQRLQRYESRNVTYIDPRGGWPIVWHKARGVWVWDVDGRKYLDLTAAFGVAAAGHANPRVVRAGQRQMEQLLHAMGDVHPHPLKAALAQALSRITFERWRPRAPRASTRPYAKSILCNSGFEGVEAALKTARLATGRAGVIAFEGAYHGLGYGALATTHRDLFRQPFEDQLGRFASFVPFPTAQKELHGLETTLTRHAQSQPVGAVIVEPIQGRAGVRVPPAGFLPRLRRWCDQHGALLIVDEIYTGFGRTGRWFACEHGGVTPDLICLGKALTGGFPLSACVGRAEVMDAAWPLSEGEAIHTSTFLGHPVGCAMALAQIEEIRTRQLVRRSSALGKHLRARLEHELEPMIRQGRVAVRGLGLMLGIELRQADGSPATAQTMALVRTLLEHGFIALPEGAAAHVLSLSPPLTITRAQLNRWLSVLTRVVLA